MVPYADHHEASPFLGGCEVRNWRYFRGLLGGPAWWYLLLSRTTHPVIPPPYASAVLVDVPLSARGRLPAYDLSRKSVAVNGEQLIAARRSLAKRSGVLWIIQSVLVY